MKLSMVAMAVAILCGCSAQGHLVMDCNGVCRLEIDRGLDTTSPDQQSPSSGAAMFGIKQPGGS